jgi:hypothetical protein
MQQGIYEPLRFRGHHRIKNWPEVNRSVADILAFMASSGRKIVSVDADYQMRKGLSRIFCALGGSANGVGDRVADGRRRTGGGEKTARDRTLTLLLSPTGRGDSLGIL